MIFWKLFIWVVDYLVFLFAFIVASGYLSLAFISLREMRIYKKKNYFVDYYQILASPLSPSISLIAPAYNESLSIIDNVKSLLALHYQNYEVVIVNDGSKDDSLEKLIQHFDLRKTDYHITYALSCKSIKGVYKSENRAYRRLVVVDKENGGKADALNAGVNISTHPLVACIDVDCVIEPDALLKMVKPFLETKKRVIATGGVVRIANDCHIEEGRLIEIRFPKSWLARFQTMEYLRAFLLGRMAWSRLNGLLLISGAFGMFDKEILIKSGGYNPKTVGEDMELVVRMRRYMHENKLNYKVVYIPDPLCWTEAPTTNQVLGRQRNRWTRGNIETLKLHKKLFFNPNYGMMGMVSYPYWFFFEWLAPWVEFFGLIYFTLLVLLGMVNWVFFLSLLGVIYSLSLFISVLALWAEQESAFKYTSGKDTGKLLITALLEPIIFHPRTVWWAIKGNIDHWKGKSSWGEMTRTGFTTEKTKK